MSPINITEIPKVKFILGTFFFEYVCTDILYLAL